MVDMALRETEPALEVRRRQYLPSHEPPFEAGHVVVEEGLDPVRELLASLVPGPLTQLVRGVLDRDGHDVLPGWSEVRVDDSRHEHVEERLARDFPVLRVV